MRRRYAKEVGGTVGSPTDNVVISTKESGNIMTLKASEFPDPWGTAGRVIQILNHERK